MTNDYQREPWERIEEQIGQGDIVALKSLLEMLKASDVARALSRLDGEHRTQLLELLEPEDAARLLEGIPDVQAGDLLEELEPKDAAAIVDELPSDDQVDVLEELEPEDAEAIIEHMDPEEAADVRKLRGHAEDTAGAIMVTEYLAVQDSARLQQVLDDLQQNSDEYARYNVQYAYAVADNGKLVGVLRMRDVLLAPRDSTVADTMRRDLISVRTDTPIEELAVLLDKNPLVGLPVVDDQGHLAGVALPAAVEEAIGERAERDFMKFTGIVGGEELRSMPLLERSWHRLSWLSINIVLNVIAASVIALYQDTIQAAITLAVFLPIISDMSGCSGNQAVAVSLRELSLDLVRPYEVLRVLWQEMGVGIINGTLLGTLLGTLAWLWNGNPYLGLIVGGALALNTVLAVALGGAVPLILRHLKKDPALASGPILTTVTDMCGFFLVLSFATALLPRLT